MFQKKKALTITNANKGYTILEFYQMGEVASNLYRAHSHLHNLWWNSILYFLCIQQN
jgi:hypothetical protein